MRAHEAAHDNNATDDDASDDDASDDDDGGCDVTTTLLHVSDLHFGTVVDAALRGLEEVVATANPDAVIVTGDVTQRGRGSELRGFVALLERLASRTVLVVPGNHDVDWWPPWRRITAPLRRFEEQVPAHNRRSVVVVNEVALLALPSVDPWRQVAGTLSLAALQTLTSASATTTSAVRVAFTHHPLALDGPARRTHVLTNAPVAAVALANASIDLLLSGHIHIPFATTTTAAFPDLPRAFVLAGAGTATSARTRGTQARSLQLLRVSSDRIEVERLEMPTQATAFVVVGSSVFVRPTGTAHWVFAKSGPGV